LQAVLLLRGERPIVPDDVAHRIGHRRLLSVSQGRTGCPAGTEGLRSN
jgi:hypothetical protein